MTTVGELDARLANLLRTELYKEYGYQNWARFKERLRVPRIVLGDSRRVLGSWDPELRELTISQALALEVPWIHVLDVLAHEMAHQYVHEVLGILDETAHGETFRRVCRNLAIDPAATATPAASAEMVNPRLERLREKVRRLLALAKSDNPHEAELAMVRARELLARHELELGADQLEPGFVVRRLGRGKKRMDAWERRIATILEDHFRVRSVLLKDYDVAAGHKTRAIEIMGTPANVEMAEYVHAFLIRTIESLWKSRRGEVGGRRRAAFMSGAVRGFGEKLDAQARAPISASRSTGPSDATAIVRREKARLDDFTSRRYPRLSRASATRSIHADAHHAGRADGKKIVLHRPLTGSADRGRLLPSGGD